jgi:hypothetical protein
MDDFTDVFHFSYPEIDRGSLEICKRAESALFYEDHDFTVRKLMDMIERAEDEYRSTGNECFLDDFERAFSDDQRADLEVEGRLEGVRKDFVKREAHERARTDVAREVLRVIAEGSAD